MATDRVCGGEGTGVEEEERMKGQDLVTSLASQHAQTRLQYNFLFLYYFTYISFRSFLFGTRLLFDCMPACCSRCKWAGGHLDDSLCILIWARAWTRLAMVSGLCRPPAPQSGVSISINGKSPGGSTALLDLGITIFSHAGFCRSPAPVRRPLASHKYQ